MYKNLQAVCNKKTCAIGFTTQKKSTHTKLKLIFFIKSPIFMHFVKLKYYKGAIDRGYFLHDIECTLL